MSAAVALRTKPAADRVVSIDWPRIEADLDAKGFAVLPRLLSPEACGVVAAMYPEDGYFRSRIVMTRHGFGKGEYKYFAYPLPGPIAELRTGLYPELARTANRWNVQMGVDIQYPKAHTEFLKRCHEAGQTRPTPLLLQYMAGDYNCLHQDLYGEHVFPLQVAILFSEPGRDFEGGEFVLTEQRPQTQARAAVVPLRQGEWRNLRGSSSPGARDTWYLSRQPAAWRQ